MVKKKLKKTRLSYASKDDKLFKKLVINSVELATGRKKLEKRYNKLRALDPSKDEIWHHIIDLLGLNVIYNQEKLAAIPTNGPVIFIANHPFGVIDGLVFGYLISKIRLDFTIIVNEVLYREELINPFLLPIDFRETKEAMRTNILTRQKAMHKLKQDQAIAIFPAGAVANSPKPFKGKAEDWEWKRFVLKMIQQTDATIVPLYFHGQNSRLFQIASHINMNFRLSLMIREATKKMGKDIKVSIGTPISKRDLPNTKDKQAILDYLRSLTLQLGVPDMMD